MDTVMKEIEQRTGREATDEEVAAGLGISPDEFLEWQTQLKSQQYNLAE